MGGGGDASGGHVRSPLAQIELAYTNTPVACISENLCMHNCTPLPQPGSERLTVQERAAVCGLGTPDLYVVQIDFLIFLLAALVCLPNLDSIFKKKRSFPSWIVFTGPNIVIRQEIVSIVRLYCKIMKQRCKNNHRDDD